MSENAIFGPLFALLLLTWVVWIVMYVRRSSFLMAHRIDLRKVDTPAKMDSDVPDYVNWPAYALKNLFELPVVFYALSLYWFVIERVDQS